MSRISGDMVRPTPRTRAGLTAALVTVLVLSGCGKSHDGDSASQSGRLTTSSDTGGTRVDDGIAAESPMSASGSAGPVDRGHASSRDGDRAGRSDDGSDRPSDPGKTDTEPRRPAPICTRRC